MYGRRPAIALVAAIAIWAPTLRGFLHGSIDLSSTATRFLLAFAFTWVGVTVVTIIIAGYGGQPAGPRRRRTDRITEAVAMPAADGEPDFLDAE